MKVSRDAIIGIISQQQDANMQRHMHEYNPHGEDFGKVMSEQEEKEKRDIKYLLRFIGLFIYGSNSKTWRIKEDNLFELLENRRAMPIDAFAQYLSNLNDKLLENENFTNGGNTINIANTHVSVGNNNSPRFFPDKVASTTVGLSYIAGITDSEPNIIRLEIIERMNHDMDFVNGFVDFCSDGEIIFHDFDKCVYKIRYNHDLDRIEVDENGHTIYDLYESEATVNDSALDVDRINSLGTYFNQVFELAGLKTQTSNRHR